MKNIRAGINLSWKDTLVADGFRDGLVRGVADVLKNAPPKGMNYAGIKEGLNSRGIGRYKDVTLKKILKLSWVRRHTPYNTTQISYSLKRN